MRKVKFLALAVGVMLGLSAVAADYRLDFASGASARESAAPVLRQTVVECGEKDATPPRLAVGDTIALTLFDDVRFSLRIVSAPPAGIAGQSFIAQDEESAASAIVKLTPNGVRITVDDFQNQRMYTVRCRDGRAEIYERDNSSCGHDECATCGGGIVLPEAPAATTTKSRTRALLGDGDTTDPNAFTLADQKAVVDILVAFDNGAKAWVEGGNCPGADSIEEFADYAINKMNMVLQKSQLDDLFCYRLAGVAQVDATYTAVNGTVLAALRDGSGALSKIPDLREKCGADTTTLLINRTTGTTSGIANELTGVDAAKLAAFKAASANSNVCDINTVYSRYTMSHETGHNMGCGHSDKQGSSNSGPSGVASYACGYHFTDTNGVRRHTVMAYNYTNEQSPDYYDYQPVPYFSSPDITPEDLGVPVGTEAKNNNRKVLTLSYKGVSEWREHVIPYDWDVRFLDDNDEDIRDGSSFNMSAGITLSHTNDNAQIYYTLDGTTPNANSLHCAPGTKITVYFYSDGEVKTLTACAVVNGVADSIRSITIRDGITWSGEQGYNGSGTWMNNSLIKAWSNYTASFLGGYSAVEFADLAGNDVPVVTVKGEVKPLKAIFSATDTTYTFASGDDDAVISLQDASFAPSGDVTFDVPVDFAAVAITNAAHHSLTFNAPFGTNIIAGAEYGHCTNQIAIGAYGRLTVAPGAGKTQVLDKLDTNWYSNTSEFRVGEGTVIFNGSFDSGKGVFGNVQVVVGSGANLVLNCAAATGYEMTSPFTVEKNATVTFNGNMEHMRRPLVLNGGTINASSRFDRMYAAGITVNDDSVIGGNGHMLIRYANETITVADGKTLTLNIKTQDGSNTVGWGLVKNGAGEMVATKELAHSGATAVNAGTFTVAYSSSTKYGAGWSVAGGATLKINSGCSLTIPSLAMVRGARLSLTTGETAPLSVQGDAAMAGAIVELSGVIDVALGASYPVLSATGTISGLRSIQKTALPALSDGLAWKFVAENGVLYAKVVNEADADDSQSIAFVTNNSDLLPIVPDDAIGRTDGGFEIVNSPIAVDGLDTKAVAITLDVVLDEPSETERTLCSWSVGGNIIRCVVTNGVLDCFHGDSGHVANATNFVALTAGRHTIQIGYYSYDSNTYGGTYVYADGEMAYRAAGLRWSNENVSRVTVGATAATASALPYEGLVVKGIAVMDAASTEPLANMTSSGGTVSYNYMVAGYPCAFPLLPAGGFTVDSANLAARFSGTHEALSVSAVASFPADATGTIFSTAVLDNSASYSVQAEYYGNGIFVFRDNGWSDESGIYTYKTVDIDVSVPHLYTMTYTMGTGFTLYIDGDAVLTDTSYFAGKSLPIFSRVTFGCGYWDGWLSSYNEYPNPMPDFKVYATNIALGSDDKGACEAAVLASLKFDASFDGMTIAEKLAYLPEHQTASGVSKPVFVDVLVGYDQGAQKYVANKGVTLEDFAQTQIGRMNDVLATNRLDRYYTYRLVGVCKVDGTYDNIDAAPGLAAAGAGDTVSLRAARELCGADTVTFLVDTTGNTLGNSSPLSSVNDVADQHECAFSACSIRAVDTGKQHTMIHENAHNMGCGHARAQGDNICSPFEYGRGFYFKDGDITRHTIMAYGGDNDASWYFSTSSSEFGIVLGNATNDNARVLRETCGAVAQWRDGGAIDFGGVSLDGVAWRTSRRFAWTAEGDTIRSFNQTNYKYQCTTPLRATIAGPKRLSFMHKSYFGGITVAGDNYSHFDILLDDSPILSQTECTNYWSDAYVDIPEGTHEVTFVFSQRFAMNNPSDNKDVTPEADDAVWLKGFALGDIPGKVLNIAAGESVNLSDVAADVTAITGEGTLVCGATLPDAKLGFANPLWKGTVAFDGLTANTATQNFQFELYGNAGSKISLTNCTINYLMNNNATFAGTLVLDGDGAFSTADGYSDKFNVFGALEGSGSMTFDKDKGQRQAYVFNTASNYTGSITIGAAYNGGVTGGRRIVIGQVSSVSDLPAAAKSASIFVKSGAVASIGGGATWSAYNGIDISGTLIVKGAGATLGCNAGGTVGLKLNDGATIRFDAADASLAFSQKPAFASGTVTIAFASGVTPKSVWKRQQLISWGEKPGGNFALSGLDGWYLEAENDGLYIAKTKPAAEDRLDIGEGDAYLTRGMVDSWLEDQNFSMSYEDEMTWQQFMSRKGSNGYENWKNFLLGYAAENDSRTFNAKIEIKDGKVFVSSTEESLPEGLGIVKRIHKKAKMVDAWESEVMDEKTLTLDVTGACYFYISIEIDD